MDRLLHFKQPGKIAFTPDGRKLAADCLKTCLVWQKHYDCENRRWLLLNNPVLSKAAPDILLNAWLLSKPCLAIYYQYPDNLLSPPDALPDPAGFSETDCCDEPIDPTAYYCLAWYRENGGGEPYLYRRDCWAGKDIFHLGCQNNTGQFPDLIRGKNCFHKLYQSPDLSACLAHCLEGG